jgi:hypothetical protein
LIHRVEKALPPRLLRRLRAAVRRLGCERLRSTYQTTFWFDLGEPAAIVEQAVLALRPLVPQTDITGVEWWLSRMHTRDVRVDFHQDRDEKLALRTGALRHPLISSVLFLNRVRGGALAVTAQPPDPANPASVPLPLDADLVAPRPNRLVWFDGRLTHGVLDADNRVPRTRSKEPGELRITLVMNWWSRRPEGIPVFRERAIYAALKARRPLQAAAIPFRPDRA